MALIAINNKQAVRAYSARLCMLIKVLQPRKPKLIYYLAIVANPNNLVLNTTVVAVLGANVIFAREDNK